MDKKQGLFLFGINKGLMTFFAFVHMHIPQNRWVSMRWELGICTVPWSLRLNSHAFNFFISEDDSHDMHAQMFFPMALGTLAPTQDLWSIGKWVGTQLPTPWSYHQSRQWLYSKALSSSPMVLWNTSSSYPFNYFSLRTAAVFDIMKHCFVAPCMLATVTPIGLLQHAPPHLVHPSGGPLSPMILMGGGEQSCCRPLQWCHFPQPPPLQYPHDTLSSSSSISRMIQGSFFHWHKTLSWEY